MEPNTLLEIISGRRTVFPAQYNSEPISRQEIDTILGAANWAPTHRRTEPWRFKVFYGSSKEELGNFLGEKYSATAINYSEFKHKKIVTKTRQAACILAICMQRDPAASVPEWEEIAATAMAVQNMWLTAHSLKIGAYWSSPSLIDFLGEHITLEEGERCLGFFYLGKYDVQLPEGMRNSPVDAKTIWI